MCRIGASVLSVLAVLAVTAAAHADPSSDVVKWSQLPDLSSTGFDYSSEVPLPGTADDASRVADDFLCSDPRAVEKITWWGSYWQAPFATTFSNYWQDPSLPSGPTPVDPSILTGFTIVFYADVPVGADPAMPYSHPGAALHTVHVDISNVTTAVEGIIDRTGDNVIGNVGDEAVWKYTAALPASFAQQPGTTYWLSIQAEKVSGTTIDWGWHNADALALANAVQGGPETLWGANYARQWVLLPDVDMAFQVIVPEPVTAGLLGVGLGITLLGHRRRRA